MEEAQFNNLCSHYKDTYEIHRESVRQRDKLFYGLLLILALFSIQSFSPAIVDASMKEYVNKLTGIQLGIDVISTLLWFVLFGFSTRYFQIVIEIERQYGYLHSLEEQINSFYPGSSAFTREGKSYLKEYPLFSTWVWLLYTRVFPSVILISIGARVIGEIRSHTQYFIIDSVCCVLIAISVLLYMARLHGEPKFLSGIRAYFESL